MSSLRRLIRTTLIGGILFLILVEAIGGITVSSIPALIELALQRGVPHCGSDGKTGETLLKTVLAPMFTARALKVLSWRGYNMLGNRDLISQHLQHFSVFGGKSTGGFTLYIQSPYDFVVESQWQGQGRTGKKSPGPGRLVRRNHSWG